MKTVPSVALVSAYISFIIFSNSTATNAVTTPNVPDSLKVPKTEKVLLALAAKGLQIYECQATDATKFAWVFKAPEAELFDSSKQKVGKHYAGPTWELNDGSKVVGEVKAKADANDGSAIPWLLLNAKSHEGQGVFASVSSIQRIDTVGGKAPVSVCNQSNLKEIFKVEYSAHYYFYTAQE